MSMGLLPDTKNCGMRMRREWKERFPYRGGGGKNVPGIPEACAIRNFTYLARGPCDVIKIESVLWSLIMYINR